MIVSQFKVQVQHMIYQMNSEISRINWNNAKIRFNTCPDSLTLNTSYQERSSNYETLFFTCSKTVLYIPNRGGS